jgi:hypothetical protein
MMGQPKKKTYMASRPAIAPVKTAKEKLQRFRALARERRHESWGDVNDMEKEDRKVYNAYQDSRDRANRSK